MRVLTREEEFIVLYLGSTREDRYLMVVGAPAYGVNRSMMASAIVALFSETTFIKKTRIDKDLLHETDVWLESIYDGHVELIELTMDGWEHVRMMVAKRH